MAVCGVKIRNVNQNNKAGLFEGSFFWGGWGEGGQFNSPPLHIFIFQEELVYHLTLCNC